MQTAIEISRNTELKPIAEVAAQLGISKDDIIPYGKYIAKIPLDYIDLVKIKKNNLIFEFGLPFKESSIN